MIGLAMAGSVRRHVGKYHVSLAAEYLLQPRGCRVIEKIELEELNAGDRLHVENVERDHASVARLRGADAPRGDLAPAARRGAQIDHAGAGLEHFIFVVDLGELIGGARAKTFALGACYVRIAELAFEPGARR